MLPGFRAVLHLARVLDAAKVGSGHQGTRRPSQDLLRLFCHAQDAMSKLQKARAQVSDSQEALQQTFPLPYPLRDASRFSDVAHGKWLVPARTLGRT